MPDDDRTMAAGDDADGPVTEAATGVGAATGARRGGRPPSKDRRPWLIAAALLAAGFALGALVALISGGDSGPVRHVAVNSATTDTSTTSTSTEPTTTTTTTPHAPSTVTTLATPTTAVLPGSPPTFATLTATPSTVTCDPTLPTTTVSITVSWSTQHSTQTVLAVDNQVAPGVYGPSASTTLTHSCTDTTHTYTVTASGSGGTSNKSVTATIKTH